jgi:polar amino acid transport system substrate-binding protein
LKVATSPLTDRGLRLAASNKPESLLLVSQFNDGLTKLKESGRYDELIEKWGLTHTISHKKEEKSVE